MQPMRTRVKICGITNLQDAMLAVEQGADALGFVFYPPSPRSVSPGQASAIIGKLPPFVTTVGLFVNAQREEITGTAALAKIDLIQFHGDETADGCVACGRPWIKAIRMQADVDLTQAAQDYAQASALLLDAYRPGIPGGTGESFDWNRIPSGLSSKIILAGGLTPDNITEAICCSRPYAVDVSGGVEATKGIKNADKIERFMRGVRIADQ